MAVNKRKGRERNRSRTVKKMKTMNNVTEVVFILDKSGSMSGFEKDTIGGFNSSIEKQKKIDGKVFVSTVLFDNDTKVVHDRVDIAEIKPMTEEDYAVGGYTALLDALGGAIHHIENIHRYARPEDVPDKTIFIITTDGYENASKKYTAEQVKKEVAKKSEEGWEFIYLAANIDAVSSAEAIGIRSERAVNYRQTAKGMRASFGAINEAIAAVRCEKNLDSCEWREEVDKDYADGSGTQQPRRIFGSKK